MCLFRHLVRINQFQNNLDNFEIVYVYTYSPSGQGFFCGVCNYNFSKKLLWKGKAYEGTYKDIPFAWSKADVLS